MSELIRSTPNETGNRSGHPRPVLTDVILYDAEFSGSEIGGFVSLSELSPPGRSNARKYAINHEGVNFPKVPIRQVAPSGRNLLTSPPGPDQQPDGPLLRSSTFNVLQRTGHFTSGRLTWSVVAATEAGTQCAGLEGDRGHQIRQDRRSSPCRRRPNVTVRERGKRVKLVMNGERNRARRQRQRTDTRRHGWFH